MHACQGTPINSLRCDFFFVCIIQRVYGAVLFFNFHAALLPNPMATKIVNMVDAAPPLKKKLTLQFRTVLIMRT